MKQWVIHAWDEAGQIARDRRQNVRPRHLAEASKLKATGNFVIGGAMLDEEGRMIGSTMIVQFESDGELEAWIAREPYIQEGVWVRYEVHPFRVASVP